MKESVITYQTSLLAQEKGLRKIGFRFHEQQLVEVSGNIECFNSYNKEEKLIKPKYLLDEHLAAPTQSNLQAWLRINYNIVINIRHIPHNQKYGYNITGSYNDGDHGILKPYDFKSFESYEDALEEGLFEGLKLVK